MSSSVIRTWTARENHLLFKLRPYCTLHEIANIFQRLCYTKTLKAITRKCEREKWYFQILRFPDLAQEDQKTREIVEQILAQRLETPHIITEVHASQGDRKKQAKEFLQDVLLVAKETNHTLQTPIFKSTHEGQSLCLLLSDFHTGRLTTNQRSEVVYDVAQMQGRCETLTSSFLKIARGCQNLKEVVFLLLGDFVDGEGIYPGQFSELEINLTEQVRVVTLALWQFFDTISSNLKVPIRIACCRGNHGRSANIGSNSNWDDVVYESLNTLALTNKKKRIQITPSRHNYALVEVQGWTGLIRHKAPVQADTLGAKSHFAGWYAMYQYDFMAYAHAHHWGIFTWNGIPIFRNGSLIGGDDYSESLAVHDTPTQIAFSVTADQLPIFITPIKV